MCVHRDPETCAHVHGARWFDATRCAAIEDARDAWKRTGGARHTDINIPS